MARGTLKLPKAATPATTPKATTSRARRAQQEKRRFGVTNAPPPVPAAVASEPAVTKPSAEPPATASRNEPPAANARGGPGPKPPPRDPRSSTARNAPPRSGRRDEPRPAKPRSGPPASHRRDEPRAQKPHRERSHAAKRDPAGASAKRGAPPPPRTAPPPRSAPRTRTAPPSDGPRLSKRMSELGLCSRREADEWIENGWVKVDGVVVKTLGVRVARAAKIEVDPAAKKHQGEQVTILLNKPVGYVSGQPEDNHPPAMVLIKPENRWDEDPSPLQFRAGHLRGLAPAGRLDIDSTGLLVFTQDGRVARRLVGQDSEVEKEYLVRVEGTLSAEGLEKLRHGLELDGVKLKPARVSWANEDQLRFVLREGRKRQIRRMCETVGLKVVGLKRVRSGGVPLGKLPEGRWRYLRRDEKF